MAKVRELKSLIYLSYDSETAFAKELNWDKQRLNKITNGKKQPSLEEIDMLARMLKVEANKLMDIFLQNKSPNEQLTPA